MGRNRRARYIFDIAPHLDGISNRLVVILPQESLFFDLIAPRLSVDHNRHLPDTAVGLKPDYEGDGAVTPLFIRDIGIASDLVVALADVKDKRVAVERVICLVVHALTLVRRQFDLLGTYGL